jgi:hypothetical protein
VKLPMCSLEYLELKNIPDGATKPLPLICNKNWGQKSVCRWACHRLRLVPFHNDFGLLIAHGFCLLQ